jgi:hypothetical protein
MLPRPGCSHPEAPGRFCAHSGAEMGAAGGLNRVWVWDLSKEIE